MKKYFSFAVKLSKRNLALELLIAIQLSVVFALLIIMMCAIEDRTVYYSIYEDALSQNGVIILPNDMGQSMVYEEDILQCFDKATEVTGAGSCMVTYEADPDKEYLLKTYTDRSTDMSGTLSVYTDEQLSKIPPYLKEGRLPKSNSEYLECLVCDTFGYSVGEIIDATEYASGKTIKMKICGILQDDQMIYGASMGSEFEYDGDFRDLYYYLHGENRVTPFYLASSEALEGYGVELQYNLHNHLVINYEDGAYTDDELEQMSSEYGFSVISSTESYYEKSNLYVKREMYTLLPIAISIFIITIFTAIITTVISTMKNLRSYAVLYLCGASWHSCGAINLINYVMISAATLIIDAVFFITGQRSFLSETVIRVTGEITAVCAVVLVVFLLLSLIIPIIVVSGKQPRDVLKTEFRG